MPQALRLSCIAIILLSLGCEREQGPQPDVFTGPAARAAKQAAQDVAPGTVELTSFSAYDTGDLIGIEGRSFIAKLPVDAPPNISVYLTHQWYVEGQAHKRPDYAPKWDSRFVERTRCWLIDVAFQRNLFAERPDEQVLFSARFESLDESRRWFRYGPMKLSPPTEYRLAESDRFTFQPVPRQAVAIGQDIPLGAWFVRSGKTDSTRPQTIAETAPAACVVFIRFQAIREVME